MENARGIWTVKEWFFNKISDEAMNKKVYIMGEYIEQENGNHVLDRTKFRIEGILGETEKAYKVQLDAETWGGRWCGWTTWIPKSVVISR